MNKRLTYARLVSAVAVVGALAWSHSAYADDCWEQFVSNTFAENNDYYTVHGGSKFMGWSALDGSGQLIACPTGAGEYYASEAAGCWSFRHHCDFSGDYSRVGATPHIHVPDWLGRQGPPATSPFSVTPHTTGYFLYFYAELPGGGHDIVDLDYIQILGTESATLWVEDTSNTWWTDGPLAPNTPPYYYDVSDFGYSIQTAAVINANGGGPVELGGFWFATNG